MSDAYKADTESCITVRGHRVVTTGRVVHSPVYRRRSSSPRVSRRGDTKNPFDHKPADDFLYSKGYPPYGRESTALREEEKAESLDGVCHGATLPNEEDVNIGSPGCQRCEVVPHPLRGPGTVHLRFGHTNTLGKVLGFLAGSTWEHWEKNGTLSIHVPVGDLAPLL